MIESPRPLLFGSATDNTLNAASTIHWNFCLRFDISLITDYRAIINSAWNGKQILKTDPCLENVTCQNAGFVKRGRRKGIVHPSKTSFAPFVVAKAD